MIDTSLIKMRKILRMADTKEMDVILSEMEKELYKMCLDLNIPEDKIKFMRDVGLYAVRTEFEVSTWHSLSDSMSFEELLESPYANMYDHDTLQVQHRIEKTINDIKYIGSFSIKKEIPVEYQTTLQMIGRIKWVPNDCTGYMTLACDS